MKKRILSLLVVCLMITSFAVVVNAAAVPDITMTVATVDGTAATSSKNIDVAVTIDKFPADEIAVIDFKLEIDYQKVNVRSVQKGDIVVGKPNLDPDNLPTSVTDDFDTFEDYLDACSVPAWPAGNWDSYVNVGADYRYGYAVGTLAADGCYSNVLKNGKSTLFKFRLRKVSDDVTGFANIKISDVKFFNMTDSINPIPANVTVVNGGIKCSAEATKYTVTASAGANGSITPAGATEAAAGTKIPYTITADTGYVIDAITVDGGTPDYTYAGKKTHTYEYPVGTSNGTISVTFKAEEKDTTITTMPNRYKDGDAIYTLGKVVEGTNGCTRYGVAVHSVKRDQEVYYSGSGKTAEGFYVVGFRGTAFDSEAATRAFADTDDGRIFGDSVTAIYGE